MASTLGSIFSPMTAITKAASASTGFFAMIDTPPSLNKGLKEPDVSAHKNIEFNDVTFSYPSRPGVKVLDTTNISFAAGQVTAIVGPSGSGKSTIVGLLEQWYNINETTRIKQEHKATSEKKTTTEKISDTTEKVESNTGSITIGGHDIQTLDLKRWRSQIGLVQQEPFTFSTSIYENVAHGLVGSKWEFSDDDTKMRLVKEACEEAFADEFIKKLPLVRHVTFHGASNLADSRQGYETMVGDNGIKLSGGQRQRLAIARSIIKRPPILILDEATSAIDVRGEGIVQKALDRVSKSRTTISIAHRLSTIKKADKIIVLRHGKAVEQGTHESLLANEDGVYYNLVHAQHLEMADERTEPLEKKVNPLDGLMEIQSRTEKPSTAATITVEKVEDYNPKGLTDTIGLLLYEQRRHWRLYAMSILAAMGCGCKSTLSLVKGLY